MVAFLSGLSKINDPWGELVTWYRDLQATTIKYDLVRDSADIGAIRRDGESRTDMEASALGP